MNKVIIIGAGFAGLQTAKKLTSSSFDVTIIDKNNYHKIIEGINIQRLKNNPVKIDQSDIKFILLNKLL